MSISSCLDRIRNRELTAVAANDEPAWYARWHEHGLGGLVPLDLAVTGGAMADRLAWVFHAGYQATMHDVFPFCPSGDWSAYLAAEDSSGDFPGTTLERQDDGWVLAGNKSWVAASRHVQHLVVRVRGEPESLVQVDRTSDGVTMSHREQPGFLAELSQGFAAFGDVSLSPDDVRPAGDYLRRFGLGEQYYVLLSLNAFMMAQAVRLDDRDIQAATADALSAVNELTVSEAGGADLAAALARLNTATLEAVPTFESLIDGSDPDLAERWRRDRRLVTMYTRPPRP